jgi:hypothetical protein
VLQWKAILYTLWSFGIHICSHFGILHQEKSGNPGPGGFSRKKINASTTTPEAAAASNAIELKLFQTTTKAAVFRQSTLDKKQKA